MSYAIDNLTPLRALARPHEDARGRSFVLVVAKGCWRLSTGRLAPAEAQVPLRTAPLLRQIGSLGLDPAQEQTLAARLDAEVVWIDHEVGPPKPRFDVIVTGHARAPGRAQQASFDASIRIGPRAAVVRAWAPRVSEPGALLGERAVQVGPGVLRVPMSHAFAGWEGGISGPASPGAPWLLPWLTDPHGSAAPWGFGPWPESAPHRRRHTGTFDAAWRSERAPRLPLDFDEAFHNTAHPELQWPEAPPPGALVRIAHLGPEPLVETRYPDLTLTVRAIGPDGAAADTPLRPDTLLIEPDEDRLSVVHRALLPAPRSTDPPGTLRLFAARSPA